MREMLLAGAAGVGQVFGITNTHPAEEPQGVDFSLLRAWVGCGVQTNTQDAETRLVYL